MRQKGLLIMKRKIILFIAIIVFVFSAYQLFTIFREYHKGTEEYKEVEENVITSVEEEATSETGTEETTGKQFKVDFDKLLELNEETVAWIRFDQPKKISYPVVQASDNDFYLRRTITGQSNSAGTLFVDMGNAGDFTDKNTFIYGHNMRNGSMFGKLKEYKSEKYCKKHPYFYIYTPDGKVRTYQVFATAIVEDSSESYQIYFEDEEAFADYIAMVREGALYSTEVAVEATDSIVSLSTCTNGARNQRMIVHGVLINTESAE